MKNVYRYIDLAFEKLVTVAIAFLGNSVTFLLALCTVIFWLCNKEFYKQDIHQCIGDIILGITFLSLFIIQKSYNRFSTSLHIKLNELVASHELANNKLLNVEEKTEHELNQLTKEYAELATIAEKKEKQKSPKTKK